MIGPLITIDVAGQKIGVNIEEARELYNQLRPLFARPQPALVVPWPRPTVTVQIIPDAESID